MLLHHFKLKHTLLKTEDTECMLSKSQQPSKCRAERTHATTLHFIKNEMQCEGQ